MVALSSGDNGGRCAVCSPYLGLRVCHLESGPVRESPVAGTERTGDPQFGPIHITGTPVVQF